MKKQKYDTSEMDSSSEMNNPSYSSKVKKQRFDQIASESETNSSEMDSTNSDSESETNSSEMDSTNSDSESETNSSEMDNESETNESSEDNEDLVDDIYAKFSGLGEGDTINELGRYLIEKFPQSRAANLYKEKPYSGDYFEAI
jgi:hypothetical protein